ncbi:MAG: hypothetical protein KGD63_09115 [Candidatus Lokiarchaeota archaeon]|nr:hypothetical protein [Candidatus Lokiarchaeota archaeon]
MNSYDHLPKEKIKPLGIISKKFIELGIGSFSDACNFVHNKKYGYNTNYDDKLIFFKEKMGTCTTKHAIIAGLAEELNIPLYKYIGIYRFTKEISKGTDEILKKYGLPYVPMVHCFLVFKDYKFDLTEGNKNGKKKSIDNFIHTEKVSPFISRKDEYLLFKKVLKEKILPSEEMKDIAERIILKAREECITLLKKNLHDDC